MESKRHTIYLYLRTQLDTLDETSAQAESTLEAELDATISVVDNGLLKLDDVKLAAWTRTLPDLTTYRFAIESIRGCGRTPFPADQEAIVSPTCALRQRLAGGALVTGSSPEPTSGRFKPVRGAARAA